MFVNHIAINCIGSHSTATLLLNQRLNAEQSITKILLNSQQTIHKQLKPHKGLVLS